MTEDEWRCMPCGTTNPVEAPFCEMCGSPQPGPTRWTSPPDDPPTSDFRPVTVDFHTWPPPLAQHRGEDVPRKRPSGRMGIFLGAVLVAAGAVAVVAVLNRSSPSGVPLAVDGPPSSVATGAYPSPGGSLPGAPSSSTSPSPSGSRSTPTPSGSPSRAPSPSASSHPSPSSAPTPSPTMSIGMVDVSAVNTDQRMPGVGGLYNSYFAAIDGKRYTQALSFYDPSGELNPNDPAQAATFTQGVSTTTDSSIVLWSITNDPVNAGDVDTRITFRSTQQPGYGPAERPDETCTLWNNTYRLHPSGSGYLISYLLTFSDQPC